MQITLGQNGLWERFSDAVFSAHTLGVSKPDPGLFEAAAGRFQVQVSDCLVIEDSASGVMAAANAGMRCLGYAPHTSGDRLRQLGAEIFRNMSEVPALIGI